MQVKENTIIKSHAVKWIENGYLKGRNVLFGLKLKIGGNKMIKRKVFAGIALAASISLIAPICVPDVSVNSVLAAEEEEAVELSVSGSFPCENGETLEYTFVDGVLTISGKGDKLVNKRYLITIGRLKR